ncbi:MAG: hypothetical protein LBG96_16570 [Tannerella sp.]|jgi:hypothetical protein|nr:hypothetical protein [Tannerella sp.]
MNESKERIDYLFSKEAIEYVEKVSNLLDGIILRLEKALELKERLFAGCNTKNIQ